MKEIGEKIQDNKFLAELLPRMTRPEPWGAGAALGMAAFNLASLPELASLAIAGGTGFAWATRSAYMEHRNAQREIRGERLFFYREAERHLRRVSLGA